MSNIDSRKWFESNNIKYIDYDEFTEDKKKRDLLAKAHLEK